MAQQIYANFSGRRKNKGQRVLIILLCIAIAALIALAAVGIIVGSDGEEHLAVSQAIAENVQLKQQMEMMNDELETLRAEVDRLGGELAARPTAAPEEAPSPAQTPSAVSPRDYYDE